MSLYITSLNSGSNGNCYYVGNEREAVLVDACSKEGGEGQERAQAGVEMVQVVLGYVLEVG